MTRAAFYGKGGIGKSTTSSNVSFALASMGYKVLQIGCDPKSDSTRQLLGGGSPRTVLEYVRSTPPRERRLDDVVMVGSGGVLCIEAGGPEPGIGCAGRGILTTFDTLEKLGIEGLNTEHTVYDVLGDVVCGGFAVPLRQKFSDAVFIVTSGEFMSVYAANNIMRGVLNFGTEKPRVAGLILNRRQVEGEEEIVRTFSESTGVPIVADIPRSDLFKEAERCGKTVSEMAPDSEPAKQYASIAGLISDMEGDAVELHTPKPLDDEQLNALMSGSRNVGEGRFRGRAQCEAQIVGMGSCASRGAVFEAGRVIDLPIIVHGPSSCGYVMSHTQDGHYLEDLATNRLMPARLRNNISCTGMDMDSTIFGGAEALKGALHRMASEGHSTVAVVTTCVPGMIGDDVQAVAEEAESGSPGLEVIVIKADGNLSGESEEGRIQVIDRLIGLIDGSVEPETDGANIVDDTFMWFCRGRNEEWVRELFGSVGLGMGVKLFEDCTVQDIRTCKRNRFTVLAEDSPMNLRMASALRSKGMEVFDRPLPRGYRETVEWLRLYSDLTGRDVSEALADAESEYNSSVERARPILKGERTVIVATHSFQIDWAIECLLDAGAVIEEVCVFRVGPGSADQSTRFGDRVRFRWNLRVSDIGSEIDRIDPDLVIGSSNLVSRLKRRTASVPQESMTHRASAAFLEYVCAMLLVPAERGWASWRCRDGM